ncbi:MAG: hypothetical protein ACTTJ7_00825 [Treponema sp.]
MIGQDIRKKSFFRMMAGLPIKILIKWGLLSIIIIIPILLIAGFARRMIGAETATDGQMAQKVVSSTTITKILSDIRDGEIDPAVEKILQLKEQPEAGIPTEINKYIFHFFNYYLFCVGYTDKMVTADYLMSRIRRQWKIFRTGCLSTAIL